MEICGLNVLTFQLVLGPRGYIIECYISPNNLTTLTQVKHAWQACPKGCLPIMLGDLNINFAALRDERDKMIAKQVDIMALVDMSSHFRQRRGEKSQGQSMDMVDEEGETLDLLSV